MGSAGSEDTAMRRAVVIGGGIAGLLAGRVLADHFDHVTIVERDAVPEAPEPRKGVPQGQHIHALFSGGASVIEKLFPGFFAALAQEGALTFDTSRDVCWFQHGVWKARIATGITMHAQSRPFLEWYVRRYVASYQPIEVLSRCIVVGLLASPDKTRVTGVEIQEHGGRGSRRELPADLVVDASGRGSGTPGWLRILGYQPPEESRVVINLGYATRLYQVPKDPARDWQALLIYAKAPVSTKYAIVFPIEGNRWIVTFGGCLTDYPPNDDAGFLEFARKLDRPDIYQAITDAVPLTPIATYRFPAQVRRRYERLSRFPDGLIVMGDAMCSFNPLYGQGMSVCALEALALDRCLQEKRQRSSRDLSGLSKRYLKRAARIVHNPWLLATGADFLYPVAEGKRPLGSGLLGWYNVQLLELASCNPWVARRFLEVLHFIKQPTALFSPYIMFQAVKWWLGLRGSSVPSTERPGVKRGMDEVYDKLLAQK